MVSVHRLCERKSMAERKVSAKPKRAPIIIMGASRKMEAAIKQNLGRRLNAKRKK